MRRFLNPKEAKIQYPLGALLRDVAQYVKPYRGRFLFASVARLAGDIAWLYPAFALASLVTFLTSWSPGESTGYAWLLLGGWAVAALIRVGSQFSSKYVGYQIAERVSLDAELSAIRHLLLLDMAWHERENAGNKLKRIQNGGRSLQVILRAWFNNLIEIVVNFFGTIIIISAFDKTLGGILFAFLVSYFLLSHLLIRKAAVAAYEVSAKEEEVQGLLFETVGNIRTVKAMAIVRPLGRLIADKIEELFGKIRHRIFRFRSRTEALSLYANMAKVASLMFILAGIARGRYEVGLLILFNGYFNDVWGSVGELSDVAQDVTVARYNMARLKDTLREPVVIDREEGKIPFPKNWKRISLKNLSFSYGPHLVLSGISFDIRRGEKIGIVGLSGVGKSTLFKLLLKEYESQKGDILFDDVSIKDISKTDYFRHVSVVLQDTEVFNFSLKENIAIANPDESANAALLSRAIKVAHVSDFMPKLPQGADTLIGEKGVKLSGGEKQRLGIARAIFKQPQLLLLDEATSHLDLESEEKIRESLHKFFGGVTAIVIAHRLTTIREMDRIFFIENGGIAESGTFASLYRKRGRFRTLWEKQRISEDIFA